MKSMRRQRLYFLIGLGLGVMLIPALRRRVVEELKLLKESAELVWSDNFAEQNRSGAGGGERLIQLEADEELPNYII